LTKIQKRGNNGIKRFDIVIFWGGFMINITILALDNVIASSVMGTMDIFCQAGLTWNYFFKKSPVPYFKVDIVTQDGKPATGLNQAKVYPHQAAKEVNATDVIVVSSFFDFKTLETNREVISWLKKHHKNGTLIASICVGSFLLAESGLLDGKVATTHWGFASEFQKRYPQIELRPERLITEDDNIICSGACGSYIDLSMYLIDRYCGREVAMESSKTMLHDFGRSSQSPYMVFLFQKDHGDPQIVEAQEWIEKNYMESINILSLSQKYGMSQRSFERRFKKATGDSPLFYVQRVRTEAAKRYLETDNQTFNEITYKVGYEDSSFFRKIFKNHTGLLPKEYRKKFQAL
jgi:transcriptional regulator GlxA family with amidase domain